MGAKVTRKLDHSKANKALKPARSVKDENEWRSQDRAAKWLAAVEGRSGSSSKKAATSQPAPLRR